MGGAIYCGAGVIQHGERKLSSNSVGILNADIVAPGIRKKVCYSDKVAINGDGEC